MRGDESGGLEVPPGGPPLLPGVPLLFTRTRSPSPTPTGMRTLTSGVRLLRPAAAAGGAGLLHHLAAGRRGQAPIREKQTGPDVHRQARHRRTGGRSGGRCRGRRPSPRRCGRGRRRSVARRWYAAQSVVEGQMHLGLQVAAPAGAGAGLAGARAPRHHRPQRAARRHRRPAAEVRLFAGSAGGAGQPRGRAGGAGVWVVDAEVDDAFTPDPQHLWRSCCDASTAPPRGTPTTARSDAELSG